MLTGMSCLWLISLICLSGRCVGQNYNGFGYSVNGTDITITNYTGGAGTVMIPSSIPGVIGTVTAIGDSAFLGLTNLTSVAIPGGVTSIGEVAFALCTSLTSATIGNGVTSIGSGAFSACSNLTSVTIPSSVTNIGDSAFQWCSGLTSITMGNGVTSIGDWAFQWCSGLTNVTLPNSVISIGIGAFAWCSGLTNVALGTNVTAIGALAFAAPEGRGEIAAVGDPLTSVTIPSSVTNIGLEAFSGCSALTAIAVGTQNPSYSSPGGVLCDKSQTTLIQFPGGIVGAYTIPSGVTSIETWAFQFSGSLTSVTIPNSVTSIGSWAFYGCANLTSAYFQGDAPSAFGWALFDSTTIYYPSTALGWSTPSWNGYPAQPYNYTPPQPPSVLSLIRSLGTVTPSFNHLQLGTNYQLQVSTDLSTWSDTEPLFTATNASEAYPQPFGVTNGNRLFFRLRSAP